MKPSEICSRLATVAFVMSPLAFAMMFVSSIYYLFSGDGGGAVASSPGSSHWLIMTGFEWFALAAVSGLVGAFLSFVAGNLSKSEKARAQAERDEKARVAREARDKAQAEAAYRQEQQDLITAVRDANSAAASALERLPMHLRAAMGFLAQAETDWEERVYNPFWSSIEDCAVELADFKEDLVTIEQSADRYLAAAPRIEGQVPAFSVSGVSVGALDAYEGIYDALSKMTRRALGDIEFATIFEAWRGNAIMEKGFTGLRAAINQMGTAIAGELSSLRSSVDNVGRSVRAGLSEMATAVDGQSARIADQSAMLSSFHDEDMRLDKDRARREREVVDEIQRMRIDQKYGRH
ncbi:hypothetical protein [Nocardia nova]|uniref:hypothetical protein n=1 Tax=Nocardia nova TaxID=37330 RepID=UPI0034023124